MKKFISKIKNEKGYALLFTILVISVMSVVTAGLINTATKQLILSSLAKDSEIAFYQADTALDCGLYAEFVKNKDGLVIGSWACPSDNNLIITQSGANNGYKIYPSDESVLSPCFKIDVTKEEKSGDIYNDGTNIHQYITTTISAKGYNFCNTTNPRTVERELTYTYKSF